MPDTDLQQRVSLMPRFRSLVTFVDGDPRSNARLDAAIAMAREEDAHLTVLAFRYDPNIPPYAFGDTVGASLVQDLDRSREEAEARAQGVREVIGSAGIRGEAIPCVTIFKDVEREVASYARFADLAVVSSPYGEAVSGAVSDILDGVLYNSDVPALVMPEGAVELRVRTVLVGWDGSRQALKAVKGALPLLQRADRVEVCVFGPKGQTPGEALATMLAHHDATVEIAAMPKPSGSIAAALAQRSGEIGADLLVMGAYSHSRFRESVIGGVTRETLEDVPVPLLIAH